MLDRHAKPTPAHRVVPVSDNFVATLDGALAHQPAIGSFVTESVRTGVDSVYLVGCGSSYYATWPAYHLLDRGTDRFTVRHMTSAEFTTRSRHALQSGAVVLAATHSGATAETVAAVRHAKMAGARVAGITGHVSGPLSEWTDAMFGYADNSAVIESQLLLFQQFAHALLQSADTGARQRLPVLDGLPRALRAVKDEVADTARQIATTLHDKNIIYAIGAGRSFGVAQALANCYLQEMQWKHASVVHAADFFHGSLEVVTRDTAAIVLMGEDESRPMTDRALRFLHRYTDHVGVLDSRQFTLPGIDWAARSAFSAIALASAARRLLDHFAAIRHHDVKQRRYMYRVDY